MTIFDETRDRKLIAAGSHFYCRAHLTARPLSEQSKDSRYCQQCYSVVQGERRNTAPGDHWTESGLVFIHMGKKYGLLPTCRTVCIGPVNDCAKEEKAFIEQTTVEQPGEGRFNESEGVQHAPEGCNNSNMVVQHRGKALSPDVTSQIRALASRGLTTRAVAAKTGVSPMTVSRIMQRELAGIRG